MQREDLPTWVILKRRARLRVAMARVHGRVPKHILFLSGCQWLPTPASARPLVARSAEAQKRSCNAAPVLRDVHDVERLQHTRLAMAATRRSDALERAPAPPAEVHGHDRQALRPAEVVALARRVLPRIRHDAARIPLTDYGRAGQGRERLPRRVQQREGNHDGTT
jgi:hypothetical protein